MRMPTLMGKCLLLLTFLLAAPASAWQAEVPLALTPDEATWRQAHPVIRVGVFAGDHMPYETWRGGQPDGLAVDYLRLLAGRTGLQLEFRPYTSWEEASFGPGAIGSDLILTQPVKADRMERFLMLRPYAYTSPALIAREGDPRIRDEADLKNARIVVERRFRLMAREIQSRFPSAKMVYADDGLSAVDMVAHGEADAYIAATWVRGRALLSQRTTHDVSLLGDVYLPTFGIAPAVRRDLPELAQILHKAESTVSDRELKQLRARWGADDVERQAPPFRDRLSVEDAAVLRSLPTLRVGYEVDRYPYSFTNSDGRFDGLAADYVRLIQQKLGIRAELVPASDWAELQRKVRAHEVDVIVAGTSDDFSPDEMRFSQPYEYFPEVIVTRLQGPAVASPRDLRGRSVAVRSETGVVARIRALLDQSRIIPVRSNEAGLNMVANGNADAFIGTLPAIDALIRNRHAAQLHVVGPAGLDQELAFGVRTEFEQLLPAVDRVLSSTEESERQAIRSRWLTTEYSYGLSWFWVIAIAATSLIILTCIALAYIRLRSAARAQSLAERELAGQLAFQQALLETIPYAVFVKDGEGRYIAINRAYEVLLDCDRTYLLGRTLEQTRHIPGEDASELHRLELELMTERGSSRRELEIKSNLGAPHTLISWLHSFQDSSSRGIALLGTLVDVSDIRTAEARARASEQRLSDITAAMPATVFQFQLKPDGTRHFTYVAGDVRGVLGIEAQQLIEDEPSVYARLHDEDRVLLTYNLRKSADHLQPLSPFEVRIRTNDEWRWLRTEGGTPRRLADGTVEWSGYWIDTTEAHTQAEALREAKTLAESAASTKAAFLATMSHEIRTPMAGVLSLIELLASTPLDRDQARMLEMADDSAQSMLQILDDILDYSRIESGRFNIAHIQFDPRTLVDSVVGLFSAKASERSLQLHAIQDWRVGGLLMGDSIRIRQVLTNLLSNAIKFTEQGSVCLSMEMAEDHGRSQSLRFIIEDTGIGIAPEDLQRLFQPFTQAEQSTARRFGGTGLGLTISRRLASMMGGQLSLESQPDRGTRAIFELTLEVAEALRPPAEFNGKRVWLRCRDPRRISELSNILSALGFSVIESLDEPDPAEFGVISLRVTDMAPSQSTRLGNAQSTVQIESGSPRSSSQRSTDAITVSGNPLLWHTVSDACHLVLGQRSASPHPALPPPQVRWGWHVLVAEDHPTNRAVIARQLESLGYDFTVVEDGEQALTAMDALDFDLLITDCHMPRLDGYALARRIRAHEDKGRRIPIIALSASALPEQVQRCLDAGMDDFLAKPVRLAQLVEKLDRFLPTMRPPSQNSKLAAAASTVPASTPASDTAEDEALGELCRTLGSRDAAISLARELAATTHQDLEQLVDTPVENRSERAQLLHRMEGALKLVRLPVRHIGPDDADDLNSREVFVRAQLHQLEEQLRALELGS